MKYILCQDCECVYIGETSRALEKRLSEHKNVVKKHNSNNEIAAHAWTNQHQVDWKAPKTRNGRELEGKSTGSPADPPTAAHLQLGLWSGNLSCLATTAWQTRMLLTHFYYITYSSPDPPFNLIHAILMLMHISQQFHDSTWHNIYYLESHSAKFCNIWRRSTDQNFM